MNLGAFTVAGLVYRRTGSEDLSAFAGLGRRSPILAMCMTAFMFSLVGLPPLAGFIAKVWVLVALINNGGWWWALVAVIGVNTIISLYYYMRIVRVMYLTPSDKPEVAANPLGVGVSIACAVLLFAMLVGWGPMTRMTTYYSGMRLSSANAVEPVSKPGPATAPKTSPTTAPTAMASE